MAKQIKVDGTEINIPVGTKGKLTLEAMQAAVGGYIELINLDPGNVFMFVNEEGNLNNLPVNVKASAITQSFGINVQIVGDVLICNNREVE